MTATDEKVRTNVYLNKAIKEEAQSIFKRYGIGLSDAFNIFLTQSVLEKGIPFDIKIPNDDTAKVIEEARNGINMEKITLEDIKKDLGA